MATNKWGKVEMTARISNIGVQRGPGFPHVGIQLGEGNGHEVADGEGGTTLEPADVGFNGAFVFYVMREAQARYFAKLYHTWVGDPDPEARLPRVRVTVELLDEE